MRRGLPILSRKWKKRRQTARVTRRETHKYSSLASHASRVRLVVEHAHAVAHAPAVVAGPGKHACGFAVPIPRLAIGQFHFWPAKRERLRACCRALLPRIASQNKSRLSPGAQAVHCKRFPEICRGHLEAPVTSTRAFNRTACPPVASARSARARRFPPSARLVPPPASPPPASKRRAPRKSRPFPSQLPMSLKVAHSSSDPAQRPFEFVESLLCKENVEKGITDHFFEGKPQLFDKYWDSLKEHELRSFFHDKFGKTVLRENRPFSFVVYGASGYTGKLVLDYIYEHVKGLGTEVTFALAGRTPSKLHDRVAEIAEKFPASTYRPEIIQADIDDAKAIRLLCLKARCVLNVAGPFMNTNAHLLVQACIDFDCDYVDVNGEVPFTHKLIQQHDYAKKQGVIIVPNAAGAGGLPDLAAFYAASELRKKTLADVGKMHTFMHGNGGVPSGGTLATRAAMTKAMSKVAKIMGDPFALGGAVGDGKRLEDSDKVLNKIEHHADFDGWSGPFTYAFYDTRLIRRTNWLLMDLGEDPYGLRFNYSEHLLFPDEASAKAAASANTSSKKEEEKLKAEGKLYALGQGLDDETRGKLFCDYYVNVEAEDGVSLRAKISAGDGYDETARVSVETALLLSTKRDSLPFVGGVLTPAVAGGQLLIDAVSATGIKFEVLPDDFKVDFGKVTERVA